MTDRCDGCGLEFQMGSTADRIESWSESLPKELTAPMEGLTFCKACLARELGHRIDGLVQKHRHESVVAIAADYRKTKLMECIDYVMDGGLMVFSKWFHLKRGSCCGSGCLNCPYPAE